MIRPRLLLLPLAFVLLGCTSFSDNDTVARFDDVELDGTGLSDLMTALSPVEFEGTPTDAGIAREIITTWLRIEAVHRELDREGIVVTDDQRDEATAQMAAAVSRFAELPDATRDYLVDAQAAFLAFDDVEPPSAAELAELYEQGPADSGITCVAHILVETEAEADEVAAELAAGADFASLAAERSIDPGSAGAGGVLACTGTEQFAGTFVPPFVEATLAAEIGVPTAPVESDFGYHVIRIRPFDEVRAELEAVFQPLEFAISRAIEQADVYVDPRYGTLAGGRVVPLS